MYLVDRGIMQKPTNEILVAWEDLSEPSTGDKLDNSKKMADVNKLAYDTGMQEPTFTESEIRQGYVSDEKPEEDVESFGEDDDLIDDDELPVKDDV